MFSIYSILEGILNSEVFWNTIPNLILKYIHLLKQAHAWNQSEKKFYKRLKIFVMLRLIWICYIFVFWIPLYSLYYLTAKDFLFSGTFFTSIISMLFFFVRVTRRLIQYAWKKNYKKIEQNYKNNWKSLLNKMRYQKAIICKF